MTVVVTWYSQLLDCQLHGVTNLQIIATDQLKNTVIANEILQFKLSDIVSCAEKFEAPQSDLHVLYVVHLQHEITIKGSPGRTTPINETFTKHTCLQPILNTAVCKNKFKEGTSHRMQHIHLHSHQGNRL